MGKILFLLDILIGLCKMKDEEKNSLRRISNENNSRIYRKGGVEQIGLSVALRILSWQAICLLDKGNVNTINQFVGF